jgi:type IV pilus assembly protein PilV
LTGADLDKCEWSNELKGAAEKISSSSVGAMLGARGCIELETGSSPPVYRVSVAWQGMTSLHAPVLTCGANQYGDEGYRRAMAYRVTIADLTAP